MPEYNYNKPLPTLLQDWRAAYDTDLHSPETAGAISIVDASGAQATIDLDTAAATAFCWMVTHDLHRREIERKRLTRDKRIVDAIVAGVEQGEDGGNLVATALGAAANSLSYPWYLVIGRPGSWEADAVLRMAVAGGNATGEHVELLTELFLDIGHSRNQGHPEDGGDTLSEVLGAAADRLGSIPRLAGRIWTNDIDGLAYQYASEDVQATSRLRG